MSHWEIGNGEWELYCRVVAAARARKIPNAIGGSLAVIAYTGGCYRTKDIDLYVMPRDREAMVEAVTELGLKDYHATLPYDRGWIYRAHRDSIIVDIIWGMANRRAQVDEDWLTRGREVRIRGESMHVLPPEEILWGKLYVMQRERCDWPDILNLLHAVGPELDWPHLLARLGDDSPLLHGALSVFAWLCPSRAREFPAWVLDRFVPYLGQTPAAQGEERIRLLDSRPWFRTLLPAQCEERQPC